MNKLKKWMITSMIFCVIFLVLTIVCILRPVGFGEWLVLTYEDITCELGGTVDGAYQKFSIFVYSMVCFFFVLTQTLVFVYISKLKKTKVINEIKVEKVIKIEAHRKPIKEKKEKVKKEKKKKEEVEEPVVEEKPQPVKPAVPVSKAAAINDIINRLKQ